MRKSDPTVSSSSTGFGDINSHPEYQMGVDPIVGVHNIEAEDRNQWYVRDFEHISDSSAKRETRLCREASAVGVATGRVLVFYSPIAANIIGTRPHLMALNRFLLSRFISSLLLAPGWSKRIAYSQKLQNGNATLSPYTR